MNPTRVACPHCRAILKSPHPLRMGKRIKCRGCGTRFHFGMDAAPGLTPGPGVRWKALLLLLAGAVVVLGGGAVLAFYVFSDGEPAGLKPKAGAETPPSGNSGQAKGATQKQPALARKPRRPPPRLSRSQRAQVDAAVKRGVAYLKANQDPAGTWTATNETLPSNPAGLTALVGLTLLEADVKKSDPAVQKVAAYLRQREKSGPPITNTYEVSLAILFFDRLDDPQDKDLIPKLALRLVGGQKPSGGWTYTCPVLSDADGQILAGLLEKSRSSFSADPKTSKLVLRPVEPTKLRLEGNPAVPEGIREFLKQANLAKDLTSKLALGD